MPAADVEAWIWAQAEPARQGALARQAVVLPRLDEVA
jgi:hypothetical protein